MDEHVDTREQARQSKDSAIAQLEAVKRQWPMVHTAVEPLRLIRQKNHFAEQLAAAFGTR